MSWRVLPVVAILALACHHDTPRSMNMVTSMVLIEACPDAKKLSRPKTTREIELLVGPCTKVPGGAAHFSATLFPNGRVELASPSGDPTEGIVPTCMVQTKTQLRHTLKLTRACRFDVKLDERR